MNIFLEGKDLLHILFLLTEHKNKGFTSYNVVSLYLV